jgi:hypothetical protein
MIVLPVQLDLRDDAPPVSRKLPPPSRASAPMTESTEPTDD